LTLITKGGEELEMPTGFDDFSEKAFRNCFDLSDNAIKNRQLLEQVMTKHGFVGNISIYPLQILSL
jgi:D-alanyl-D-alanine dipeptidase